MTVKYEYDGLSRLRRRQVSEKNSKGYSLDLITDFKYDESNRETCRRFSRNGYPKTWVIDSQYLSNGKLQSRSAYITTDPPSNKEGENTERFKYDSSGRLNKYEYIVSNKSKK